MENKDARIFITSVSNISKRLEHYGDVDISQISLLKLIYKYACYSPTYSTLQRLDSMVSDLQRTSPYICLEKQAVSGSDYTSPIAIVEVGVGDNIAPTITSYTFNLSDTESVFTFSSTEIYNGYNDSDGHAPGDFVINSLPVSGTLLYDGVAAVIETLYSDPALLTYTRNGTGAYSEGFTWSVYDTDSQLPLASNIATMTANVAELTQSNQPATVGDRAQYQGNRATTIFTVADFTTETILPYFDPEGNDLDAIRVDEVSTANTGKYYYFNDEVTEGQIITKAELDAGAFYHIGPDANSISTDSFNASVRDTGSMIWVQ